MLVNELLFISFLLIGNMNTANNKVDFESIEQFSNYFIQNKLTITDLEKLFQIKGKEKSTVSRYDYKKTYKRN